MSRDGDEFLVASVWSPNCAEWLIMRQVIDRMHMSEVTICYGMTETSPVSFQWEVTDDLETKVSTIGSILPLLECKIVDPATGHVVPRGEPGELWTRGYSVMLGYWNDAPSTAAAIDGARRIHTGDLAVMRDEGYARITGRLKDMIDVETRLKGVLYPLAATVLFLLQSASAFAQAVAPPPVWQPFVRNTTRAEMWRYFEPPPPSPTFTPGDPTTDHIGNRLLAGVRFRRGHLDATLALQYVQFGGLPDDAIGPGALGTGALYYDHSGSTTSHQVYLKTASIAFRQIAGHLDVQVGRLPYTGGAERASGVPKIEAVKRQRLDSRLVGEFEWSLYQRAFDGVRADWTSKSFRITGTAFQPTQGGFEDAAGVSMSRVRVLSAVATTAPGAILPKSEVQVFVHRYDDRRPVSARPDNTGRSATAADIGITAVGGHVAGARPAGAGEIDGLVWLAGQFGDWYEQSHRGFGVTAEVGYQWPKALWTPWVRGGASWFSGDGDSHDASHGTFFPMVPTVRRYAQSTLYSMANLRDIMGQVILRPARDVTLRVDGHFLSLANPADGWYAGSGATQESGRIFGYTLRSSGNEGRLMDIVEGSVDWRLNPAWSVSGYLGVARSGRVVRHSFQSGSAAFVYLENIVQF